MLRLIAAMLSLGFASACAPSLTDKVPLNSQALDASGPTAPGGYDNMPEGIAPPDEAIAHWSYSDPVYMWRITSAPRNAMEPAAYFYWPDAVIEGEPTPFLPVATRSEISASALEAMSEWAQSRSSNALIIAHRGEIVLERYWNGMTAETLANGRAMTRSMAPLVLGFALQDESLSLDDPIGKYIDAWANDPRGKVTVEEIARNIGGLELPQPQPISQIYGNRYMCLFYCGDVKRAALEFGLAHEPGTVFNVSDQNMQVLAMVLEAAMKEPIEQVLSERVWKPIGASDATFQRDRPGGTARVVCCMRATPRDWLRLGQLVMRDGQWEGEQVLPPGWTRTMATPSAVNPNHGMGLWLGTPFDPLRTYYSGKPGVIPMSEPYLTDDVRIIEGGGFRVLYMSPSHDLVIFRHGISVDDWDGSALVNMAIRGMKE